MGPIKEAFTFDDVTLSPNYSEIMPSDVITETVFAIPGMGRLITESIAQRDFQIIQSTILIVALIYVLVNLIIDVLYVFVDPRIRYDT